MSKISKIYEMRRTVIAFRLTVLIVGPTNKLKQEKNHIEGYNVVRITCK